MEPDQQLTAEKDNNNHDKSATIQEVSPTQTECDTKSTAVECDKDVKSSSEEKDFEKVLPVNNIHKSVDSIDEPKTAEVQKSIEIEQSKKSSDSNEDVTKEPIKQTEVPPETTQTSTNLQTNAIEKSETEDKSNNSRNDNIDSVDGDQKRSNDECAEKRVAVAVASNEVDEKESSTNADGSVEVDMKEDERERKPNGLPLFPGTVTKPVAGSNDVKIEIASSSLFDRVILYSLKNKVVDNSRLDAAKNKYLMNNGQANSSFTSNNSNGSDSNSSSKSVDKLIDEFKGSCKSNIEPQKSDSNSDDVLNGAENKVSSVNSSEQDEKVEVKVESEVPQADTQAHQSNSENEALDFRDKCANAQETNQSPFNAAMLDLSVKRDDKSVPPIKRSHALYVGLPDFSKQIFTAPSITRTTNTISNQSSKASATSSSSTIGPPKVKNPDFSTVPRASSELQMRNPDFSKGFSRPTQSPVNVQVTPSNFPEIARKNNYISDLQLKPPTNSNQPPQQSPVHSSSYKIDYRPPSIQSQSPSYPNMKKESIYNYSNQHPIDEPMAHVIPKNQFNPIVSKEQHGWNDTHRGERLLGGSSHYDQTPLERKIPLQEHSNQFNSNEDLRKIHPAHYPYAPHSKEERNLSHEFSLKQKEQQLRQEGTIITIKNEAATKTPTHEIPERRSADLFRDYKLKQPKESPDTASSSRRIVEPPPLAYHQQYPDFPANYPRHCKSTESLNMKADPSPIPMQPQEFPPPSAMKTYHSSSPSSQPNHRQPRSPLTVPPGPSLMNPPQNWIPPPPLVMQTRPPASPQTQMQPGPSYHSSTPPHYYPPHPNVRHHSRSPSQSPIPGMMHPPFYGPQKMPSQYYKYPESINRNDMKDPRQNNNYYHHKQPDFARRFEDDKSMIIPDQQANRSFVPIEGRPPEMPHQRLPVRQDLEIKTIRHPSQEMSQNNMQYRPMDPNAPYYQRPDQSRARPSQEFPQSSNYPGVRSFPPDLKIEKRTDDVKAYPIPIRRPMPPPETIPELSIIPKVKSEPPQTPVQREEPSTSNVVKSTKSLFTEVKRESPLDLSVKTVKTKADSTGCDQDFQSRHRAEPTSLKIEFAPNFGNVSKTDCRQQARLGPQEYAMERTIQVGDERPSAPLRFSQKDSIGQQPESSNRPLVAYPPRNHPNHSATHMVPLNNKGQPYPQKYPNDMDRPHAPVPSIADYYNHKNNPPLQMAQHPQPGSSSMHRYENNYHNEAPPNASRGYTPTPQSVQYPVINKPSHVGNSMNAKSNVSVNPKDPLFLEKQRDRKYVEEILYGRSRNIHPEQQPPRQHAPIPSPPRKRHLEAAQQMYGSGPPKQVRVDDSKPFDPRFSHPYIDPRKVGTPPTLVRHENYPQPPMTNNHVNKQYPVPRKDAIKSAEMIPYSNPNNSSYYPNPKAEMIYRSDPNAMNKYHFKDAPTFQHNQNFQHRPDDGIFPNNSRVTPHSLAQPENNVIKVEQQQITGPMSELQQLSGEKPLFNGVLLPPTLSGSNGNIPRGAEQSTIQKLKSNLELKEQQKLKIESERHHHHQQKKDLSPRQFRTKAEMKGYTPLPVNFDANRANIDSPSNPNTSSAPSAFDLLDWGSACNDFVQQLQTGNKRKVGTKKKRQVKSDEKTPSATIPGTACGDLSQIPKEILNSFNKIENASSSDEDKPLQELKRNLSQQDISDKLGRNFREKKRQEVEEKFAARLGKPSSSESETDTRKGVKNTKKVRRLRKRAALGIKKTDDEHSKEEGAHSGETDDDIHAKRRHTKSISKHDDLTSSDEETEKKKANISENNKKTEESKKKVASNSRKASTSIGDAKQPSDALKKQQSESSSESSGSTSSSEEELTMEDKINKLSERKNVKKLKDLGDKSNIKNLLEEGETMTRSKRKLEIEKKLSNSKILRNEKVVQNKVVPRGGDKKAHIGQACNNKSKSLSPLKRKDSRADEMKRKAHESDSDGEGNKLKNKKQRKSSRVEEPSSDNNSDAEEEIKAERLRPRKPKVEVSEAPAKVARKKVEGENTPATSSTPDSKQGRKSLSDLFTHREDKLSKFAPGWETEAYNFKRSLKIPPGLITIGRPPQHGISHSLPDLDPQTSDTSEIFSEFVKSKDKEGTKDSGKKTAAPRSKAVVKQEDEKKKPSSIIDLLHHRVMQSKKKLPTKKKAAANANAPAKNPNESESLLPTPEKESEKIFGVKKNIFETFILTSRTRTENNTMRKKEILKEVFGADEERPRSAPPSADVVEADKNISYDQKFREYLEKMNVDFLDNKKNDGTKCDASVKDDDDDFDDNETIAASEKSLTTPTSLGKSKMKKNRPRRSKGSSGFDYIRKKKKPTPHTNSENPMNVNNIIKKRLAAMESLETKDENDICKEIKGWVRNKSVGESILHKASRLNYVDVVAYCLDRLGMDPDTKDNAGYTPLHEACSRGHLEIARLLLQFGANHSETALSGIRPLHEAIENGHIEIVRLLLSFGADPCLATYSGQLPIQMAEDKEMENFLQGHLSDVKEGIKASWFFDGAFKIEDPDEIGYDIFDDVPINKADLGSSVASVFSTSMTSLITATTQMSDNETVISETTATSTPNKTPMKAPSHDLIKYQHKMKKCDTNSNNLVMSDANNGSVEGKNEKTVKRTKDCSVILNNIDSTMKKIKKLPAIAKTESPMLIKAPTTEVIHKLNEIKHKEDYDDMMADENIESDCEFLEVEESEAPLPPLYLLKDEGTDKWILLTDLCNLLKVKSKESVLKQICPSSPPSVSKELIREMKMCEFLERATCLQLFCAGEKINVRASKVSLVRYNESVKNLLGVQTFKLGMNM